MGQLLWQEKIDRWSRFDQFPSPPPASYCIASSSRPSSRHHRLPSSPRSSNTNESFFFCTFAATAIGQQLNTYINVRAGDPVRNILTPPLWRKKKSAGCSALHGNSGAGVAVTRAGRWILSSFKIIKEEGRKTVAETSLRQQNWMVME